MRDLEELDTQVTRRILKKLDWVSSNFARVVPKPLTGEFKGTYQAVAQTSSSHETEAFTAESAEHAESNIETLMLYLSDLCVLCGKMLETRSQA